VEVAELFEMRAISRLMQVQNNNYEAGTIVVASNAARGLNIFGRRFRLKRIDGGKLRFTGATWSDAVVIFRAKFWPSKISCAPGPCAGQGGRPPCGGTRFWRGRFRGGRMSGHFTSVERIDGGKLRCTGATWSDPVVIFPGEVLAFQNIERQAHVLRAPAPGGVVKDPPAKPDCVKVPVSKTSIEALVRMEYLPDALQQDVSAVQKAVETYVADAPFMP
jgi:hypothetical protein